MGLELASRAWGLWGADTGQRKAKLKAKFMLKTRNNQLFYTPPGKGFLGVYNPDPQLFLDLIMLNEASSLHKKSPPSAAAAGEFSCKAPKFVFNRF